MSSYDGIAFSLKVLKAPTSSLLAGPWLNSNAPTEPSSISSSRASALESETRSESKNASSAVLSTEGCIAGPCWANENR